MITHRLIVALTLIIWAGAAEARDNWTRYCNERFGQCADIPGGLTAEPPPANDDGRKFSGFGADDFELTLSASRNSTGESVAGAMRRAIAAENTQLTLRQSGRDWFAISGFDGGTLFYMKQFVRPGSISTLYIRHAADKLDHYRPMVTRISRSFTPAR